jgi:AraC-like DNA-binding protein
MHRIPPLERAHVAASHTIAHLAAAAACGADLDAFRAEVGFDERTVNRDSFVSVDLHIRILDGLSQRLRDPIFGVKAGKHSRLLDHPGFALLLMTCANGRKAFEQYFRFEALSHDSYRSELLVEGDVARMRFRSPWFRRPDARQLIYSLPSGLRSQGEMLLGQKLSITKFNTSLAPPADGVTAALEDALETEIEWNAGVDEVVFPAAFLDIPIPSADPAVFAMLQQVALARLDGRDHAEAAPVVRLVGEAIADAIPSGQHRLEQIAGKLKQSPRTLQRKLAAASTSFSNVLDEVRRKRAEIFLREGKLSMIEIALMLGFEEQSSFNHAFRRWFGVSPKGWLSARR